MICTLRCRLKDMKGTPINPSKRLGEELAQGGIERDPDRYLPEDNM